MAEQLAYLIIGNGIAGVTAAEILRSEDAAADISVIADDPFPVYYRPALKDYLAGRIREDKLWARPNSFYQQQRIRFIADRVMSIQAGQHTVQLQSGRQLGYNRLLLANGARAAQLTCPGLNLAGVTTLRTVADYQAVLSHLDTVRRVVVSGSGTLALETIETLRHRGYQVSHLLRKHTLWSEVLDATASDLVLQQERRDGVDVHLEEEIAEITGKNRRVTGVVTTAGTRIPCDMVIIAIGIEPIIDFIKGSGIPCGRGVKVDSAMRTGAPDIYAAGDVLETTDTASGRVRVIGQWFPAIQQARAAAYSMLGLLDSSRPFSYSTFYNATFLYGLDFATCGLTLSPTAANGYQVIVADPQPRVYRKILLKDGVPAGVLSLGDRRDTLAFKRAIDHGVNLSPVASRLFHPDFKINDWLDQQGVPPPLLKPGRGMAGKIAQTGSAETEKTTLKSQPLVEAFLVPTAARAPGGARLAETPLSQTGVCTIGRQPGVYLLIDHGSISRRHAVVSYERGQYVLRDAGSANGTFVNDRRLEPDAAYILQPGDQLRFGDIAYTFRQRLQSASPTPAHPAESAVRMGSGMTKLHEMATGFYDPAAAGQVQPPSGQPILNADGSLTLPGATRPVPAGEVAVLEEAPALAVVTKGIPRLYRLKAGQSLTLGRDQKRDIVLLDAAVSRKHARIFHAPDGFYIRDTGSSNGVIVNQAKIDNPYRLVHGDRITIGSIQLYFFDAKGEREQAEREGRAGGVRGQAAACRSCGTTNMPTARFCANCGSPLS